MTRQKRDRKQVLHSKQSLHSSLYITVVAEIKGQGVIAYPSTSSDFEGIEEKTEAERQN